MRDIRIAKPYAQALYDAAAEQAALSRIVGDANQIISLAQESKDFEQFLTNPILSPQFKSEMFQQLLSEAVQPLTLNFLLLLASKQRERFLVAILQAISQACGFESRTCRRAGDICRSAKRCATNQSC